ncbi:serine/threonine-protein kinase MARK2-like [Myotis yumanensis]|uniref:serine/threonine-protein kinase MARK2-like n=1 Tax=Myotis yumanensis TaxID=159337 RepID=UPI0038D14E46
MFNICPCPSPHRGHYIGEYLLLNTIQKGPSSEVRLAQHILTGAHVIVKAIRRKGIPRFYQEVHCFKKVNHPNIAKLFEVLITEDKFFLVMENIQGDSLLEHLQDNGTMSEGEARTMFRQVVSAVQYCHQKNIIHRDLTPGNILIDNDMTIKLIDFGYSKQVKDHMLSTFCGSIGYAAPEMLQGCTYDGRKSDVWSLGVLLYRMLTGVTPFEGDNITNVKRQIISGDYQVPSILSKKAQKFLRKLLTVDPSKRPTMEAVMKDRWLNKGHKKIMKPYREPPKVKVDPEIVRTMNHLGCRRESIEDSLGHRKFDRFMGTYLILTTMKTKMPGRHIKVKPFRTTYTSSSSTTCSSQEVGQPLNRKTKKHSIPPNCQRFRVPAEPIIETKAASSSQSTIADSITSIYRVNTIEISGSSQISSSTTSSSSDGAAHRSSQGWREAARRAFQFLLRCLSCGSSAKVEHHEKNKHQADHSHLEGHPDTFGGSSEIDSGRVAAGHPGLPGEDTPVPVQGPREAECFPPETAILK